MDLFSFMGKIEHPKSLSSDVSGLFCTEYFNTTDILRMDDSLLIKRIFRVILTGNEKWAYDGERGAFYYNEPNLIRINSMSCAMMSNYFSFSNNYILKHGQFRSDGKGCILFKNDNCCNLDDFIKWLKDKHKAMPVEVYAVLRRPVLLRARFYYDPNPRFRGVHALVEPKCKNSVAPIVNLKKELFKSEINDD